MGPPLVTRQVSNLLVVHFIGRLSLETKPRPRSLPTLSIVWRQLMVFWCPGKKLLRGRHALASHATSEYCLITSNSRLDTGHKFMSHASIWGFQPFTEVVFKLHFFWYKLAKSWMVQSDTWLNCFSVYLVYCYFCVSCLFKVFSELFY